VAFALLVGLPIPLVGLVGRFGWLASGSTVASRRIRGTGPPGDWGSAAGWARGEDRNAFTPRRHNSSAGIGVLEGQGQGDAEGGPKQRSHDDQELAEMAKRSIHEASSVERHPMGTLPTPHERNSTRQVHLTAGQIYLEFGR
jgi:hypothetical protein